MLIIHYSCNLSIIQKLQASMIDYPTGEYILINVNALFPPSRKWIIFYFMVFYKSDLRNFTAETYWENYQN